MAPPVDPKFVKASNNFTAELYQKTIEGQIGNVIISPVAIQSVVTLAFFGANGKTAEEMKASLKYPATYSNENIAKNFQGLSEGFAKNGLIVVATKTFGSEAQDLNFTESVAAAKTINDWVEGRTNNIIKDLIESDSLNDDTRMILVNAIYFKGFWKDQFDPQKTFKGDFSLNDKDVVTVDYMKMKNEFIKYGAFPDYDATAIELPFRDSDISMMIILPNSNTGLSALEEKLNQIDLPALSKGLWVREVTVEIPKFKIEFGIELNEPLQKLGMNRMFSDKAEFNELIDSKEPLKVSKVIHKAIIDVNEDGVEPGVAPALEMMVYYGLSIPPPPENFKANYPFIFCIKNKLNVFFMGRLCQVKY